jgi:hypothetical protein
MPETVTLEALRNAQVGRLGLCREGQPYIVPLNFAYQDGHIYAHCAETGTKIDFIRSNPNVCFEVDERIGTMADPVICDYETAYRSVVIFGRARVLTNLEEKTSAMRLIAVKYAFGKDLEAARKLGAITVDRYRSSLSSRICVIDIVIDRMTGKHYGTIEHESREAKDNPS